MHPARVYYGFSFLFGLAACMCAAVYVPYLEQIGLSFTDILLINAGFWGTITLAEVPTGMVADGRSRRWSVNAGLALHALVVFGYPFAQGVWSVFALEVLGGVGFAFLSGTLDAWLADALERRGESVRLERVLGTASIWSSLGIMLGGFIGGWIATLSQRAPFFIEGILTLLVIVYVHLTMGRDGEPIHRVSELQALRGGLRALRRQPALRWLIACSMVLGFQLPFHLGWSLHVRNLFGALSLSWVWVYMMVMVLVAGVVIRRRGIGPRREMFTLCASFLLMGVALVVMGARSSVVLVAGLGLHEFMDGVQRVVKTSFVQHRVTSEHRATSASLQSLFGRIGSALVLLVVGLYSGGFSAQAHMGSLWAVMGLLLAGSAVLLWLFRPRQPS